LRRSAAGKLLPPSVDDVAITIQGSTNNPSHRQCPSWQPNRCYRITN
jgi:hypothetical protein